MIIDRLKYNGYIGKIILLNLYDSIKQGILDNNLAKNFINDCNNMLTTVNTNNLASDFQILSEVRKEKYIEKNSNVIENLPEYLYTVTPYSLIRKKIDTKTKRDILGNIYRKANDFCNNVKENKSDEILIDFEKKLLNCQEEDLKKKNLEYYPIRFFSKEKLKNEYTDLIWFSKEVAGEILKEVFCHKGCASNDIADIARDNRGLIHLSLNRKKPKRCPLLVVLKIKTGEYENLKLWRPTIIDAGDSPRFRSIYEEKVPCKKWGRAIHLETLEDKYGKLGTSEAVSLNFEIKKAEIKFLGYPKVPRGDFLGKNDDKFFNNILDGRDFKTIVNNLKAML